MVYKFSMVVPHGEAMTYSQAVHLANELLSKLGTQMRDLMPWTTEDRDAVLVHSYPVHSDVQATLAEWLNNGTIYEYHIMRSEK